MAAACADMLKAVSQLCNRLWVNTDSRLFICGLSEGGHAALALQQRRIETDQGAQPFHLTASAPMAGAYDIRVVWGFLSKANPTGSVPLLIHIYLSYRETYKLTDRLKDVFIEPYDRRARFIDDGTRDGHEMFTLLPKTIQKVMNESFLDAVASGEHPLDEEMEGNSAFNFPPASPTRLYHGRNDELAPFSIGECGRGRTKPNPQFMLIQIENEVVLRS
jgi:pimeloyl-ACP methyl ester carboxylesterase